MPRARLCLLIPLGLIACKRGDGPNETAKPTDEAQEPAQVRLQTGDGLPIVLVDQELLWADPIEWAFDPSGRFVAADIEPGVCGVWDIESGTLVRRYGLGDDDDEFDPCIDWLPEYDPNSSADGKLRARFGNGLEIETVGGGTKILQGCTSCGEALAWSPSGHQIATCNGERLEIWDADSGQRIHGEPLDLTEVGQVELGWTLEGLGAMVVHDIRGTCEELEPESSYCYGYYEEDEEGDGLVDGVALSSFWWAGDGEPPIVQLEFYQGMDVPDFVTDPGLRWLAYTKQIDFDRAGSSTELHVVGLNGRSSALGWLDDGDDGVEIDSWEGHWRVDTVTQWIEGETVSDYTDYSGYGSIEVGWNALVAEPNPALFHGTLATADGLGPFAEVEVFAAAGGSAVARWEACVEGEDEECSSGGPAVGDCELLDISPSLALALVDCDSGLQLIEASGPGRTVAALRQDPDSRWRWGRGSSLALLEDDGDLTVVDPKQGKPAFSRTGVEELLEIPLGPEQHRLALAYVDHLEIVDAERGDRVIDVPGDWDAAALSPDGKQLAVLGGKQVRVLDIQTAATLTSFAVKDEFGLAFRQDGAALFIGYDWPAEAFDPKTGKSLYFVEDRILDDFEPDAIDPSWRWLHEPDGSVVRTLDFARISMRSDCAWLESGVFDGELGCVPADHQFRVGDEPDMPPIYTSEQLEPWLRAPGLVTSFFSGAPLPSPRIPAEAVAKLET